MRTHTRSHSTFHFQFVCHSYRFDRFRWRFHRAIKSGAAMESHRYCSSEIMNSLQSTKRLKSIHFKKIKRRTGTKAKKWNWNWIYITTSITFVSFLCCSLMNLFHLQIVKCFVDDFTPAWTSWRDVISLLHSIFASVNWDNFVSHIFMGFDFDRIRIRIYWFEA